MIRSTPHDYYLLGRILGLIILPVRRLVRRLLLIPHILMWLQITWISIHLFTILSFFMLLIWLMSLFLRVLVILLLSSL